MRFLQLLNTPVSLLFFLTVVCCGNLLFWGYASNLNKSEWASWVQAAGSVLAIVAAFVLGERQSVKALEGIRTAERLVVQRKIECIIGIADACAEFGKQHGAAFQPHGFPYLTIMITEWDVDIRHLVTALDAIPIHEIGSMNAVSALIELKKNTTYLERALTKASNHAQGPNAQDDNGYVMYDTAFITINCDQVQKRAARLKEVLSAQISN